MWRRALLGLLLAALLAQARSRHPRGPGSSSTFVRPEGTPRRGVGCSPPRPTAPARDITPAGLLDVQGAAWSPNGRRIAISAIAQGDHDPEIFVMAADGSALHRVTNNHLSDRQPTWSPDGRRIAFASARTGLFQIYAMRADGVASGGSRTRATPVTRDGRLIAFTWMPDGANQELFMMRRDGTGARQITATNGVIEGGPDWQGSP